MSTLNKRFTATLQRSPSKGGWTYVVMPGSADYFKTRGPAGGNEVAARGAILELIGPLLGKTELLPAYQGQGIGTQLIRALMDEAHKKGISMTLQV